MMTDAANPSWMPYATLLSPILVALAITLINMHTNSRLAAERDLNHNTAIDGLKAELTRGQTDTKGSLEKFGARLGTMQDEVIRLQTGIGMGGEHGLFAEMRDTRRIVEEVRAAQATTVSTLLARVGVLESQVANVLRADHG